MTDLQRITAPLLVVGLFVLFASTGTATNLRNIEAITPFGSQPINLTGEVVISGNLSMDGQFITDLSTSTGGSDSVLTLGNADTRYVLAGGDVMSGNLDLSGNQLRNVEALDSDGATTNLDLIDGGNVQIPSGQLGIGTAPSSALDISGGQIEIRRADPNYMIQFYDTTTGEHISGQFTSGGDFIWVWDDGGGDLTGDELRFNTATNNWEVHGGLEAIGGNLLMNGNNILNADVLTLNTPLADGNISNSITVNAGGISGTVSDGQVSNTLTVTGGSVDKGVLANSGSLSFDWSDAEVSNTLTLGTSSTITLAQGTAPAPTTEGRIEWDTDDDRLVVGDGASTQTFYSGSHTTDTNTQLDDQTAAANVNMGGNDITNIGANGMSISNTVILPTGDLY